MVDQPIRLMAGLEEGLKVVLLGEDHRAEHLGGLFLHLGQREDLMEVDHVVVQMVVQQREVPEVGLLVDHPGELMEADLLVHLVEGL